MPHTRHRIFHPSTALSDMSASMEFSMAVRAGQHVHVRGMTGLNMRNEMTGAGDVAAQTENALDCLKQLLEEVGSELGHICKITVYVTRREDNPAVYRVIADRLAGIRPVSTGLIVAGFAHPDMLVEIDAVAIVPERGRPLAPSEARIDPELAAFQAMMAQQGATRTDVLSAPLASVRANTERFYALAAETAPAIGSSADITIDNGRYKLPARLHRPETPSGACLLYVHGGGFALGSARARDSYCRHLVKASGVNILAIDYRLAPEHPYPAALQDTLAAWAWLETDEAAAHGIDPARIAIGGDSCGATLSLAASMERRDKNLPPARLLALTSAMADLSFDTASHRLYGDGRYGLSSASLRWFWDRYLVSDDLQDDPLAVPLLGHFHNFPPTILIAAELDPLRDDSLALHRALTTANIACDLHLYAGMTHNFALNPTHLTAARTALALVAGALAKI